MAFLNVYVSSIEKKKKIELSEHENRSSKNSSLLFYFL